MLLLVARAILLCPLQDSPQDQARRSAERLYSDDIEIRERAEMELAVLGDPAVPVLEEIAASSDSEARARARQVLAMIDRGRRLPGTLAARLPGLLRRETPLVELLALGLSPDERRFFARRAAKTLDLPPALWYRTIRGYASGSVLATAARSRSNDTLRAYALAALQEVDPGAAVRVASELIRSPSAELAIQAAWTLGEAGPPSSAADLSKLLADPRPPVARSAERSLLRLVPTADIRRRARPSVALSRGAQLLLYAELCGRPGVPWKKGASQDVAWDDLLDVVRERIAEDYVALLKGREIVIERRGP